VLIQGRNLFDLVEKGQPDGLPSICAERQAAA